VSSLSHAAYITQIWTNVSLCTGIFLLYYNTYKDCGLSHSLLCHSLHLLSSSVKPVITCFQSRSASRIRQGGYMQTAINGTRMDHSAISSSRWKENLPHLPLLPCHWPLSQNHHLKGHNWLQPQQFIYQPKQQTRWWPHVQGQDVILHGYIPVVHTRGVISTAVWGTTSCPVHISNPKWKRRYSTITPVITSTFAASFSQSSND
jgi:hypothetical protein